MNNTFRDNESSYTSNPSAAGCAIYCLEPTEIVNNIFYYNSWLHLGGNITLLHNNNFYGDYMGYPTKIYCETSSVCYEDVASLNTAFPLASGNILCDPAFATGSDYLLNSGSCCIDSGTAYLAPSEDIDGDARPFGPGYDIGADEFTFPIPIDVPCVNIYFMSLIFTIVCCMKLLTAAIKM